MRIENPKHAYRVDHGNKDKSQEDNCSLEVHAASKLVPFFLDKEIKHVDVKKLINLMPYNNL